MAPGLLEIFPHSLTVPFDIVDRALVFWLILHGIHQVNGEGDFHAKHQQVGAALGTFIYGRLVCTHCLASCMLRLLCPVGLEVKFDHVRFLQLNCQYWCGTDVLRILCPDGPEARHNDVRFLQPDCQYWSGTGVLRLQSPDGLEAKRMMWGPSNRIVNIGLVPACWGSSVQMVQSQRIMMWSSSNRIVITMVFLGPDDRQVKHNECDLCSLHIVPDVWNQEWHFRRALGP